MRGKTLRDDWNELQLRQVMTESFPAASRFSVLERAAVYNDFYILQWKCV